MVLELTPCMSDDEDQYGLYLNKTGRRPTTLSGLRYLYELGGARVPICHHRDDYSRNYPQYLDHVWLNREDWDIWHKHVSTREMVPMNEYDDPDISHIWRENIGLNRRL